jgi:hypothetical protein
MTINPAGIGRFAGRLVVCFVVGWVLSVAVFAVAFLLAVCFFGSLEQALDKLPETRVFSYSTLGYFGASIGAGVGGLVAGLLRITATEGRFRSSIHREMLPSGGLAAFLGLTTGLWLAHYLGRDIRAGYAAILGGAVSGVIAAVSVRLGFGRRKPATAAVTKAAICREGEENGHA